LPSAGGLEPAKSEPSERADSWSEPLAEACFEKGERIKHKVRYSGRARQRKELSYCWVLFF
jgi:hypothetical protein